MKAILTYQKRNGSHEEVKGSIIHRDGIAIFSPVLAGSPLILENADLTQMGGFPPHHNTMYLEGMMDGWKAKWIVQIKEG